MKFYQVIKISILSLDLNLNLLDMPFCPILERDFKIRGDYKGLLELKRYLLNCFPLRAVERCASAE